MEEIGELLGFIIIFLYALTVLRVVLGIINKKYHTQLIAHKKFNTIYRKIMIFVMKYHKIFGLLTIMFIIAHFIVQFNTFGISITGVIAASMMIIQIVLGIYGATNRKASKSWLIMHRIIAAIILIAILVHII